MCWIKVRNLQSTFNVVTCPLKNIKRIGEWSLIYPIQNSKPKFVYPEFVMYLLEPYSPICYKLSLNICLNSDLTKTGKKSASNFLPGQDLPLRKFHPLGLELVSDPRVLTSSEQQQKSRNELGERERENPSKFLYQKKDKQNVKLPSCFAQTETATFVIKLTKFDYAKVMLMAVYK